MSRVAVVVGINKYNYSGLRDLSAPANDAEAIAQRLEKYGNFTVIRLPESIDGDTKKPFVGKSKELTLVALESALENLFCPDSKQCPDTVLFYFSGHGLIKKRGEGFLATSDTNPSLGLHGLSLRWLRDLLKDSPIKQQLVWLDCCHSGAMMNVSEADAGALGNARDRCFIAASRDFEVAYQAIGSPYSVLTKALLDGLNPQQTSTKGLTNLDLVAFLDKEIVNENQKPIFSNFGEPIEIIQRLEKLRSSKPEIDIDAICPYKGLAYFDDNENDPRFFFGRKNLTDLLVDRIRQNNCLVLLGASGSGKSSVLRAGLLSQLRLGDKLSGSDRWKIQTIVPTEHPLKSLAESFVDPASNSIDRLEQLNKAENLLKDPHALRQLIETSDAPCLVLVIDQFEECFTLCQDMEERQQFFNLLINAIAVHSEKFRLVIAMRADFFGKCVDHDYGGLAKQLEAHLVAVTPMNDHELREAIARPAKEVGCEVETLLVDEIVKDVAGAPANLPLMQFALAELWKYREGNQLTLNAYKRELGGISSALEKRANEIYEKFSDADKKAVKHIFVLLTRLGERNEEDTRRRVAVTSLVTPMFPIEAIERVVKELADKNLVVTTTNVKRENVILGANNLNESPSENLTVTTMIVLPEQETTKDVAIVEVAHEALIRSWSKMREWLEENREVFRQQQKLEERAEEWEQSRRAKSFLLQGLPLQNAVQVNQEGNLNPSTKEFIKKSQRKQITSRFLIVALLVVPSFTLLILLPVWIYSQATSLFFNNQRSTASYLSLDKYVNCTSNPNAKFLLQILMLTDFKRYLRGANICGKTLGSINLSGARLAESNFEGSNLDAADLRSVSLEGANLKNTKLRGAKLKESYLKKTDFEIADLENADLTKTQLEGANFEGANLKNVDIKGAILLDTKLKNSRNLTEKQINEALLCRTTLPNSLTKKFPQDRDCLTIKKKYGNSNARFELPF
jgi:uncharacterized protein YjbI with pentapeptide repeats